MLDSLILEINTVSEKSITEKRKEIFSIINSHFALNLNINVDNSFNKNEVITITNNSLESNGIDNDFHFTITDESGVLILSNFENIDNKILKKSTSFSVAFLNDDLFSEKGFLHFIFFS